MKTVDEVEIRIKQYYTSGNCRGLSTIYTPKEVRDKMTIHAKPDMKILVMFNFEFCYDLWKLGCKDVMFVSDDEVRNMIVEETWKYKTELIEPRDINKKINGMKLDLIIGNPPYNKGVDIKIFECILELSDNICIVHPANWLLSNIQKFDHIKNILSAKDTHFELFDGNELFGIRIFGPCVISTVKNQDKKCIVKYRVFSDDDRNQSFSDIQSVNRYGIDKMYRSICQKIDSESVWSHVIKGASDHQYGIYVSFGGIRGDSTWLYEWTPIEGKSSEFNYSFSLFSQDDRIFDHKKYGISWKFNSKDEAVNFQNYLKTKFARFCYSIGKYDQNIGYGLSTVPWLDFSRSWTDDECASLFNLSKDEIEWIKKIIPDFY